MILGNGIEATERLTLTRILGVLQFQLKSVGNVQEGFQITWGIGLVSSDAFSVGVGAVPSPQDDMDWGGWLMHGFVNLISVSADVVDNVSNRIVTVPIDVKAQRVMGPNDTVFMTADYLETGTATMTAMFDSRVLIKVN